MPGPKPPSPLELGGRLLRFDRPVLMGVLNVTPDSFSDGGRYHRVEAALRRAARLVSDGADIVDIGGESTRPGALAISSDEECARVLPVLEAVLEEGWEVIFSIDTSKSEVARAAIERGALMINDVTALGDPETARVAAAHGAALVLMHMRGEPRSMQQGEIRYGDLMGEICAFLRRAMSAAIDAGVSRSKLLVDPGIGFGKTVDHNLSITKQLGALSTLEAPIVYGPSRKSFLGAVTGREIADRERATAAACVAAILAGAHVLRVHDVAAVSDAAKVAAAIRDRG